MFVFGNLCSFLNRTDIVQLCSLFSYLGFISEFLVEEDVSRVRPDRDLLLPVQVHVQDRAGSGEVEAVATGELRQVGET